MSNPTKCVDNLSLPSVFHYNREDIARKNESRHSFTIKKIVGEMYLKTNK